MIEIKAKVKTVKQLKDTQGLRIYRNTVGTVESKFVAPDGEISHLVKYTGKDFFIAHEHELEVVNG